MFRGFNRVFKGLMGLWLREKGSMSGLSHAMGRAQQAVEKKVRVSVLWIRSILPVLEVRGSTFPIRWQLKVLGLRWDPVSRCWRGVFLHKWFAFYVIKRLASIASVELILQDERALEEDKRAELRGLGVEVRRA